MADSSPFADFYSKLSSEDKKDLFGWYVHEGRQGRFAEWLDKKIDSGTWGPGRPVPKFSSPSSSPRTPPVPREISRALGLGSFGSAPVASLQHSGGAGSGVATQSPSSSDVLDSLVKTMFSPQSLQSWQHSTGVDFDTVLDAIAGKLMAAASTSPGFNQAVSNFGGTLVKSLVQSVQSFALTTLQMLGNFARSLAQKLSVPVGGPPVPPIPASPAASPATAPQPVGAGAVPRIPVLGQSWLNYTFFRNPAWYQGPRHQIPRGQPFGADNPLDALMGAFGQAEGAAEAGRRYRQFAAQPEHQGRLGQVARRKGALLEGFGQLAQGFKGGEGASEAQQGAHILKGMGALSNLIPMVGGAVNAFTGLTASVIVAADKIKGWTENLHAANMKFAEYSPQMAQVQARQEVRDIFLEMDRGERRADSAERLAQGMSYLRYQTAKVEDFFGNAFNEVGGFLGKTTGEVVGGLTTPGGVSFAAAGAIAGGILGSYVPVIGTWIGATVGGAIGSFFGNKIFGKDPEEYDTDMSGAESMIGRWSREIVEAENRGLPGWWNKTPQD